MISYSLSYFVHWNSFTHLWFREKVSGMCLKQHQLAQGVKFSRTVIIRYIKWSKNIKSGCPVIYTLCAYMHTGNLSNKVYCTQGEHKGPRGFAHVILLLATSICSWYGMRCCCTYRGSRTPAGQHAVGWQERLFWKANYRCLAQCKAACQVDSCLHLPSCYHLLTVHVVHIPELESPHSLPTFTNVALRDHDYCSHMVTL